MENKAFEKTVFKVGIVTIIWNAILSLAKAIIGILASSSSLVSDAVHSASDVFSTVIVMIGAKLSCKAPDKEHPFGHERMESIASIILAMLLAGTAFLLGYNGVLSIIEFAKGNVPESNGTIWLALGCAVGSIIVKFLMYVYTIKNAKKINSTALKADAFHHLSDSLSSIGSVLGVIGMLIGGAWAILDPIACLIISIFIVKVAFDIGKDAIGQVVDKSAPEEFNNGIRKIVKKHEEVRRVNGLKTRQFGNKIYVELEVAVDGKISVEEGHNIAEKIHDEIEEKYPDVKHCMVHVDPFKGKAKDEANFEE